ncbi:MAG: Gfo/Idh/MocA family protein [Chitinivibrionales bacterium]
MSTMSLPAQAEKKTAIRKPRIGFLGVGWIGRDRMSAMIESECIEPAVICDPDGQMAQAAAELAPYAHVSQSFEEMLQEDLDGVVIATPSAMHATQAIQALKKGKAVFCQKPLGRSAHEVREVIAAARKANRLLGVDLSYRYLRGIPTLRSIIQAGDIGDVYGINCIFHNAYGPDKEWFYDPRRSGGGCVIDLGIHLVDLALWMLDFPDVTGVQSRVFSQGRPLNRRSVVEDYGVAQIDLDTGAVLNLSCSWGLQAGCDAIIELSIYGTRGGVSVKNVDGSFYDFTVERFHGTHREILHSPPDAWGGRAGVVWARRLAMDPSFHHEIDHATSVANVIDLLYENHR